MFTYYIDYRETANGHYEVHHGSCRDLPERNHLIYLGRHDSGVDALTYGRTIFANVRACKRCCPECNLVELGSDQRAADPNRFPPAEGAVH